MSEALEVYKKWAPDTAEWTQWTKPVLFASLPNKMFGGIFIPKLDWISEVDSTAMIILDLPDDEGVKEGLALARLGYRPVPLYNGVNAPNKEASIINVSDIQKALYVGAKELRELSIFPKAPPAFLLDSRRMQGRKQPGAFDNRWCVFPQDMPSASYLLAKGIKKILVRSKEIQDDLSHILCRYQEQGIRIFLCDEKGNQTAITVAKPSRFKSLMYRFKVILGLTRNAAGGFGGKIPEPTQHNSGSGYYGIG